ncbi:MAG TPA: DedA family protein [Gaiellaceae bacterium]|jgi:membrane protein DedA with SNARE-associated domain
MTVLLVTLPATRFAYLLLALLVGGESAGIPLPGETALITGAILASQDKLSLSIVIAVAALAAIVGDNIGFQLGRHGARRLLTRPGRFEERRLELVERGEAFFLRHGGKTVFLGRWLPFLRITAAWLAGAHHMSWPRFLFWNAAGGIAWAVSVGVFAYFAGHLAIRILHDAGYVLLALVAIVFVSLALWYVFRRR